MGLKRVGPDDFSGVPMNQQAREFYPAVMQQQPPLLAHHYGLPMSTLFQSEQQIAQKNSV